MARLQEGLEGSRVYSPLAGWLQRHPHTISVTHPLKKGPSTFLPQPRLGRDTEILYYFHSILSIFQVTTEDLFYYGKRHISDQKSTFEESESNKIKEYFFAFYKWERF